MNMETKELLGQLKGEFESSFKEYDGRREAEVKAIGTETAETKASLEAVQDKLDALELKLKDKDDTRLNINTATTDGSDPAVFKTWLKTGQTKGMIVSDDSEGGFLAPAEMLTDIMAGVVEMSELRDMATVRSTSNRSVQQPKRVGLASAAWIGEIETRTETATPLLGMDEIPTHEMYARVSISQADLDDTSFDLEGWVKTEASEQFGVLEGNAFLLGNGVKKPHGILVNTDIEAIYSGSAGAFTYDGIMDLVYGLKTAYAANAQFGLNRLSIRNIRKLKDSTGQPLWQPRMDASAPATIAGYGYRELPDMPTPASAAKAALFGDFRKGYTIVDRIAIRSLRDELTAANVGQVILHMYRRVGGQVAIPEALKVHVLS